jgi:hypothetical protein
MMCRQIGNEQFMPKDIRERHHELTKRYLMTNSKYRQYIINSELEASIIADICYCHRRVSIPSVFEAKVTVGAQVVNARFLSGLLRIADEMDMDYRRASECTMELISLRGDSADHWKACQLVNGLTCDSQNSVIEISCTIKNDNDRRIATNAARKLNQERQQTVPYFEFGLKYNSIRCRLKNPIDKDEYLVVLNDITEQLFHQVYRKRKGEDFVYRPRVPIQRLMSELEESSGGMP